MNATAVPKIGETYRSGVDPELDLWIEEVAVEEDGFFLVEACHPDDKDDMAALSGIELDPDEWQQCIEDRALILAPQN
jgi:hypothetical protein